MKQSLTFFQIFDLAFFAPGVILAAVIDHATESPGSPVRSLTQAEGWLALVAGLAAVYVLGLTVHSLVFSVIRRWPWCRRWEQGVESAIRGASEIEGGQGSGRTTVGGHETRILARPSALALGESAREGLILYFWYLRATCWNVAMALVLSVAIVWAMEPAEWVLNAVLTGLIAVAAPLLVWQGGSYHWAYRRCIVGLSWDGRSRQSS